MFRFIDIYDDLMTKVNEKIDFGLKMTVRSW